MKWRISRPRVRARFVASVMMASAVSLLTVASASAQTVKQPSLPGVPTELSVLPDLPTAPGGSPTRGIPLDQLRAAAKALAVAAGTQSATATAAAGGISAVFMAQAGVLAVTGTAQADTITVSRDAAGRLLVNGGTVPVLGGTATVANTTLIEQFGLGGNDALSLDEANGALPNALLFGGAGNDILTGGSGADQMFGEAGNDTLLGKGGIDLLFGGAGNDQLTGGTADDQAFGEAGDDRILWNPGEGSDINEGGDGTDTIEVNGGNGAETFSVIPNGTRVRFDRTIPAPFFLDIGTSENLTLNMNGGDDSFTGANGLATLIKISVDGGTGNDTIVGGDGDDTLNGGDGNDTINGNRGADTALMGAGDDTFTWNPGDGSDVVDGQDGSDLLQFNGANVNEQFDLSANGGRLRLFRNVANITMDVDGVEHVNVVELGGTDTTTVNDLSKTDVTDVQLDLAATPGSGVGDGSTDTVSVSGNNVDNTISVTGSGSSVSVTGLPTNVSISGVESQDRLTVLAQAGDDAIDSSTLPAGTIGLSVDGGNGNDTIKGSDGDDTLIGGAGKDFIDGNRGNDTLVGGDGNDTFPWDPGDGSDSVEGGAGIDTLQFNGSDLGEQFDLSANGTRLRLFRDVGSITMDVNAVEKVNLTELAGVDTTTVGDLTGTGVTNVQLDLSGTAGSGVGDGANDTVIVSGTTGDDVIKVSGSAGSVSVDGLAAKVGVTGAEATDGLTVRALAGIDTLKGSTLAVGTIGLTLDGGDGDDIITGSDANDLILGGRGNDTALMGTGDDTFVWNPGDGNDVVEGQAGSDLLQFNGANINEQFDLAANGSRLRLFRNVANIIMDVDGVEHVNVVELGGADTTTVNNLAGTAVEDVRLDLAATPGSGTGDGASDTVIVNATDADDAVRVSGAAGSASVDGLATIVTVAGGEASNDTLIVNALGGDDAVDGSAVLLGTVALTFDGGNGDDALVGGHADDTLLGGAGDDELIGGDGQDILDGGTGNNILIQ